MRISTSKSQLCIIWRELSIIGWCSPSQRKLPLKPSQIDLKLKYTYTKRSRIPPPNPQPVSIQQALIQQRRSSQMTTP